MDCRNIRRALPALADGDLRPVAEAEARCHLEICPECAAEWEALREFLLTGDEALAYTGPALSFDALRARMATIEPLEEVLRYQLPKLHIPGAVPRFATAMVLLALLAGVPYAFRHTRQVYIAVQSPFEQQEATLLAALEEDRFPGDPLPEVTRREDDRV
jgi:anti-sigma factor RsiW